MKKLILTTSLILLSACSNHEAPKARRLTASLAELPPPELGEVWGTVQEEQAERILDDMLALIRKRDAGKAVMNRDAHPKAHGCAMADFDISLKALPEKYKVGIFSQNQSFKAWVRYSNGNTTFAPDLKKDVRGMAIKLMNVKDTPTGSQDLLMINAKEFFTKDADDYADLFQAVRGSGLSFVKYAIMHPKSAAKLAAGLIQIGNPLAISYFSSVPYKLGPSPMRFQVEPCKELNNKVPRNPGDNYLREKLVSTLKESDVCFDFYVHANEDKKNQPVEDPRIAWNELKSPVYHVAKLTLKKQEGIDSKRQLDFCENLSYDPWHSHAQTRPLGQINRMRGLIYKEISRVRHESNRTKIEEPTGFDLPL